jgi:pyridoxamine 5'-phosphate oxidase family protein
MNLLKSTKYRNVLKNNKVALVIGDLKSIDPCDPRGMKIYGTADIVGDRLSRILQDPVPSQGYLSMGLHVTTS